jgi:phage tail-like protein
MAFGTVFNLPVRLDAPLQLNFAVEIDGELDVAFESCVGLDSSLNRDEIKENNSLYPIKRTNGESHSPIILRKGYAFSDSLWRWYEQTVRWQPGDSDYRRSVSIVQLYPFRKISQAVGFGGKIGGMDILSFRGVDIMVESKRFNFLKVWPAAFKALDFNSTSEQRSVLELQLEYAGIPNRPYDFGLGRLIDLVVQ